MTGTWLHCGMTIGVLDAPGVSKRLYCGRQCREAASRARAKAAAKARRKPSQVKIEEAAPSGRHADFECDSCGASVFAEKQPESCEHCGGNRFARIHRARPTADLFQQMTASVRLIGDECRASRETMATFKHKRARTLNRLMSQVQALADRMMRTLTDVDNPDHVALEAEEMK